MTGFGIGFGVASLATPQLLADRYGTTAYASIAGTLAAPVTLAKAGAPLAAAALAALGGYPPVLATISALCLLAGAAILARARTPSPVVGQASGVRPSHIAIGTSGR